jgi:Flp pilus assembly protein TadD
MLVAATIVAYFPVWNYDFVNFDDPDYVTHNRHVLAGLTLRGIAWAFFIVHASNWHPLTWISHMTDVELFGAGPAEPHIVNVLLHAANAVLVFLVLKRMSGALWRSAFVAALFALHPLHVESVAWISERKDVLSTFFGLLALWKYAFYVEDSRQGRGCFRSKNYRWALLFFVLALLSKPMIVTLPFVMLLLDYWPLQRYGSLPQTAWFANFTRLLREKTAFLFFSAAVCALTLKAQTYSEASAAACPISSRIENVFVAYVQYLENAFWPADLTCMYLRPANWPWPEVILDGIIFTGICLAVCRMGRRFAFVPVGWLWYLGMLVPVIGLVQVGFQYKADRYTYMPLIGIFAILAWSLAEMVARWRKTTAPVCLLGVIFLIACGVLTREQLRYWQNGETLFSHSIALAAHKNNYIAYNNLGDYLCQQNLFAPAIDNYKQALQIKPDFEMASKNLGVALIRAKRYDEAISFYQNRLRLNTNNAGDYSNLGFALTASGRLDEAMDSYKKALQIKPDLEEAVLNLAGVFVAKRDLNEAVLQYLKALQRSPDDPEIHLELGGVLQQLGKLPEAEREFHEALALNPNYQKAQQALQGLGAR